jgi:hypothetical protein
MATRYNYTGGIVTNGLVLNLDAAKVDSYPGTGTTWRDLSGNNNNGTLTNGPTFSGIGKQATIVFDGVNDFVSTSYSGSNNNSDFTFSTWFNPLNATNTAPLNRGRDNSGNGWSLLLGTDNSSGNRYRAGVVKTDGETVGYVAYSTSSVIFNQWVYITGVWISGNSINLYVNGVFNSSVAVTGTSLRTSTDGWVLGSITTTIFSNIQVASAQIYNRALSADEVSQNFNALRGRYGI